MLACIFHTINIVGLYIFDANLNEFDFAHGHRVARKHFAHGHRVARKHKMVRQLSERISKHFVMEIVLKLRLGAMMNIEPVSFSHQIDVEERNLYIWFH